jgi:hypothetical protein
MVRLMKQRVVILAEAGSGKSTELMEQARLSVRVGRYTFSATVQNVGRRGLEVHYLAGRLLAN